MLINIRRLFLALAMCCSVACLAIAQSNESSWPRIVGGNVGVDCSYCESAKADFDLIAQVANEKQSNVIVIARLGKGELRKINHVRLRQLREWLLQVRGYAPERIVTAEGERMHGLGQVEVYISGRPIFIYRMRRNKDFFRGCDCP
ncbi:MAG TPA: hypothetical protein VGW12_16490 [Pyrinomonadaceae bacterium]|nr:hypothetical protein [Pyrinomonadaceae bacterium]